MMTLEDFLGEYPGVLNAVLSLDQLVGSAKHVDPVVAEIAFLRTSVLNGCARCFRKHLASLERSHLSNTVLSAIVEPTVGPCDDMTAKLRTALRLVDVLATSPDMVDTGMLEDAEIYLSKEEIREIALLVAAASMLNRLVLCWTPRRSSSYTSGRHVNHESSQP